MPERNFSSPAYRYGYQGSEKDDEIKGEGNDYMTHYRHLDPRVGRWMSRDPKVTAFETPYSSMSNNPIFYNDKKGDTISFRGNKADTEKVLNSFSNQLGAKNLKYNKIFDSNGNLSGVDIYKASVKIAKNGNDDLNKELANVINSTENVRIFKVATDPKTSNEVENKGGAMSSTNPKTIKEYTGSNEFKRYIFLTDKFFKNGTAGGSYITVESQSSWWVDDEYNRRYVPFNEAIFHETIHQSFSISGKTYNNYYDEENAVIRIMNKYRVQNKIHERGLWFYYTPSLWESFCGERAGYKPNPFVYDDYTGESNKGGFKFRGNRRANAPYKIGTDYE